MQARHGDVGMEVSRLAGLGLGGSGGGGDWGMEVFFFEDSEWGAEW
jgi:hypothetical protein